MSLAVGVGLVVVHPFHFITIENHQIVALDIRREVVPVDSPCIIRGGVQHILAESDIWTVITDMIEQCGHYVDLLHDAGLTSAWQISGRVIDKDRNTEITHLILILDMSALAARMVGTDHEYCITEPRLFVCRLEETVEGIVGIFDSLVKAQTHPRQ